jgi:hypothetical protein
MRTVMRIAILLVAAGACRKKAEAPPAEPSQGGVEGVEIVSPGTLPRQALRYQLAKGVKTQVEMEIEAEFAAPGLQRTMPTAVSVMELGADDVLPDGNARVRTTVLRSSARARPGAEVSIEAANAQGMMLSGLEVTGTLTPRGRILEPKLGGGANLPPKAAEGMAALVAQSEELAMPLPESSIGVGAIWRVRRDTTQLGIKMETVTEIEVTALEDKRVSYAMRTQIKGANQHTKIEGIEVDVANVRGSGAGRGVLDLGRMTMFGEQSLELEFDIAAMKEAGAVRMRTTRRLRPASDAPGAAEGTKPAEATTPAEATKPAEGAKDGDAAKDGKAPPDPGGH